MSDLPDLDTTDVSLIAYWNGIDAGVDDADWEPEELLGPNIIKETELYDNGWEALCSFEDFDDFSYWSDTGISPQDGYEFHMRAKTDGWLLAWIDTREDYTDPTGGFGQNIAGVLANNWSRGNAIEWPENRLSLAMEVLLEEADFDGGSFFTRGSPSWYSYQYSDATNMTWMSTKDERNSVSEFQYTDGTTVHYAAIANHCRNGTDWLGEAGVDDDELINDGYNFVTFDLEGENRIPNADTAYRFDGDDYVIRLTALWS